MKLDIIKIIYDLIKNKIFCKKFKTFIIKLYIILNNKNKNDYYQINNQLLNSKLKVKEFFIIKNYFISFKLKLLLIFF